MRPIYAYKRKAVVGYSYNITDSDLLYNHSCVVKKKKLTKGQIKIRDGFTKKRLALQEEFEDFIKEVLG